MIDLTGIILKQRYCIIEQIGQGGQGCLYLARDLELGILWAVKELPIERKKEAKLMRMLSHPSLPKMVDYTEREEFCYLVMEYIKGKSLGEWLREGRVFTIEETIKIGIETAGVLEYLHAQKPAVYYGDLKPDNLMLTDSGHLYLVDLGSAVSGYRDRQQVCMGTVGYAAPEQFEGRMTAASDVYALGRTLAVLCGKNRFLYMMRVPGFGILLWRCCQKKEKFRYRNITVVKERMKHILGRKRKYGMFSFVMSVVLAMLMGTGLFLVFVPSEKIPVEEALSSVTAKYYETEFLNGNTAVRNRVYEETEQELHLLLKEYPEKELQRKLLLMLALNGELQGEPEHAAVYYEQLLLYDPEFGETYGRYGLFLCRQGLMEESRRLWERYCEQLQGGQLEQMESRTLEHWKERIGIGNT